MSALGVWLLRQSTFEATRLLSVSVSRPKIDGSDVRAACRDIETKCLAFSDLAQSGLIYVRLQHDDVLFSVLARNQPISLVQIEVLNNSKFHFLDFFTKHALCPGQ